MTITAQTVPTGRMTFHCRIHGDPERGLPMLLLHGSFATSRWWEPFFAILPDEVFAVAPDLRGCGQSDKTAHGYDIDAQADDILALVDALGWRDFDLVGHSSGGAIALEIALARPNLLNTLILVDSVPAEGVHTPLDVVMILEQMKGDRELLARALASLMPTLPTAPQTHPDNAAFFEQLVDDAAAMAPAAFTEVALALDRWNRFAAASALTLPTLVVWGDQDQIVSREATTRTLIAIPGAANLEVLRGVGHSPMIEAPLRLAERIIDFVSEDFAGFDAIRSMVEEDEPSPDSDSPE